MRLFHCDRCGQIVPFTAHRCPACDASLGYVTEHRSIRVLQETAVFATSDRDPPLWRYLNAARGRNWMLRGATDTSWCRSCQLTRGRPDEAQPDAVEAWSTAETDRIGLDDDTELARLEIDDILDAWRPIDAAVNAIAETLGTPADYRFEPIGVVVDKLTFVHRQVGAHTERDRFHATH